MRKTRKLFTLVAAIALFLLLATAAQSKMAAGSSQAEPLVARLLDETAGDATIAYHAETGQVRFIGTSLERPIPQPATLSADATAEDAARGFLATYGSLFGLSGAADELTVTASRTTDDGRTFVRFQQNYEAIPILAGELVVQLNANGDVISANGEALPNLSVDTTPAILPADAQQAAIAAVAKANDRAADSLVASQPELWIFNPALLGGPGPRLTTLVWRMEVTVADHLAPIRELVLVDAKLGLVALHFNQIDTARDRKTYDAQNGSSLPGVLRRSEGQGPYGDADVDNAHDFAGDTYDFFFSNHGRDSLDDNGMTLISTTHYCEGGCPYQNAFWSGEQMVYGTGYSQADDVVGHELTHGVTDFSSHLFYYYQSGAINESFSDVWGEFIDQTNGAGNDSPAVKWLMGEDIPGIGAIRDMKNPPAFGDPDRIGSANYYCGELDNGGVHFNSGVNNKAAYLMTDGGSFNGYTVSALGIAKVADLYYEVENNMLVSGSDYNDLYSLLNQAAINLGYSAADRQEIQDALHAVEMDDLACGNPAPATICNPGQTVNNVYFNNLENPGSGQWAAAAIQGSNGWFYPQNPNGIIDATYATSGVYNFWGFNQGSTSDSYIAMTGNVSVPANAFMHFNHSYGFENDSFGDYDGGVVEYSTNNGSSWQDAGSLFASNGYNGTISNSYGNPLGGRSAFVRDSRGYTASRLNLSSLSGQNVRFRFRIGTDSSVNDYGWFIDDIRIYTCGASVPLTQELYLPSIMRQPAPTPPPPPPPAGFVNPGFESGPNVGWTEFSANGWDLILPAGQFPGGVNPHAGSWAVWLGGALSEISYVQQQITVPAAQPYLAYWHWIASEDDCGYDFGGVVINGATVAAVYDLCAGTSTGGWVKKVVNLSAYAGQNVAIQIRVETDDLFNSNLFVDDVSFQSTAAGAGQARPADAPAQAAVGKAATGLPNAAPPAADSVTPLLRP